MRVTRNLTEGNIYKNYLFYSFPLILSSLLSNLYSTVDAMIAGKFISEHALGAISATGSFEIVFSSFLNGFGAGFAIYVAQLFGKGDNATLKRDILNMMTFVAAASGVISLLAIAFCEPILDYLKVDPILREDAKTYFIIYTSGYVISYLNMIMIRALYSLGVTSFTIYVSVISAVINIGGNLLSVLVFDLGVAGLAISTLLSIVFSTFFYVHMLRRAFKELASEKSRYRFSISTVTKTLRYTVPAAIQQVAFHGVAFLTAPAINALGAAATTGYTVINKMYGIASLTIWNMTSAMSCYASQCVGEKKYSNIPRGLKCGFIMNCVTLLPFVLAFVIFAKPIASLYFPAGYVGEALDYAVRFSTFYMPFLFINMIGHLLHAYMRSLGCVNVVFWITMVGSTILVGATLLLIPVLHMEGVFIGKVLSWSGDALLSVVLYVLFFRTSSQIQKAAEKYCIDK